MSEHTKTPWKLVPHKDGMSAYVYDANGDMIFGDLDLPIAEFIVRAVNSYDAILELEKATAQAEKKP